MRHYYYSYQSIGGDPSSEKWSLLLKVTVILWQSWFCLQICTTSEPKHIIKSNSSQVILFLWGHVATTKWDSVTPNHKILYVMIRTYREEKKKRFIMNFTCSAAAAESLQSCPTLCDPIDGSPPGSPVPGILRARILEWVAISFSNMWKWKVKVKSLSRVRPSATPWTAAYQAPPSMGFFQARVLEWGAIALK